MAFVNSGIGAPPKKKTFPPPPIGGEKSPAPFEKPAAKPFGGGAPAPAKAPANPMPEEKAAMATAPTGGGDDIPPEAVCYRSEMESCGNCQYNAGGTCDKLQMPVSDGDSCNLFKDRQDQAEVAEPGAEELPDDDDESYQ